MRVGIVGAGITGLALTHHLAARDVDSVTLEASAQPGGVIGSREHDGHVLEVGPQRMRKTPGLAELAEAAGVADAMVEAPEAPLSVYAGGQLCRAPLSGAELARTDLLSTRGKARLLAEPLTRPGSPAETVAELFTRKFGREAYERFVGPLYGGLYGSDPAEMPAAFALEGLLEREAEHGSLLRALAGRVGRGSQPPPLSFEAGNQQLPRALAERYGERIEFETPVTDVEWSGRPDGTVSTGGGGVTGRSEAGYVLRTPSDRYHVDTVVVTTPAATTADLLGDVAPDCRDLSQLRYNPLALVYMEGEEAIEGKGYQVGYDEQLHTLGVSFNGLFGRERLYTAFLGGMHEPELVEASDERLARIATEEFERVTGVAATEVEIARLDPGFPAWDHSWWTLEELETPPGIELATNYTERMGIPSRVREARQLAERLAGQERDPVSSDLTPDNRQLDTTADD